MAKGYYTAFRPSIQPDTYHAATVPLDGRSLDQIEKNHILKALEKADGVQTAAAKILGISRRKLQYRMKNTV